MKTYQGKTVEEAIALACEDLQIQENDLVYKVETEKKTLFGKKVVIEVYEMFDIIQFAEDYLLGITDSLGVEASVRSKINDDIITITIDSTHNPILIGRDGITLQALNELVRLATSNRFHKHFRILLDVNGYKNKKYFKLGKIARKFAREVQTNKQTYTFDPMPSDERRYIHNALAGMEHIKTESTGEGKNRKIQIIYVD